MDRVLGLDGGGSKTLVAIVERDGGLASLVRAPGLDPLTYPDWPDALRGLVGDAKTAHGPIAGGAFGLPVHGEMPAITAQQDALAQELFGAHGVADNDVRVAFEGALGGQGGVLLLSGTGSMAWASRGGTDAAQVRVGGWGDAFGDEGSAFWIGRNALAETSRVLDGRSDARPLADAVLRSIGTDGDGLMDWTYGPGNRRAAIATLARTVSTLAEDGDAAADAILDDAAAHLAAHARTAWRRTGATGGIVWACAGGAFRSAPLRNKVGALLGAEPRPARLPPVGGTVLRAAQASGWAVDESFIERLAAALHAHPALDQ
ncbi:MAG: ATPase [Mesorhizobium amorphae]|nr:MAG: ATPase [Mesorhizobium amorphae]